MSVHDLNFHSRHLAGFDRRTETPMFATKTTAAAVLAAATMTGLVHPAQAQEGTQGNFMLIFKMKSVDKDKDGMVSKKEFMAAMEKACDMKAKAMNAKGGMTTDAQLQEMLKALYKVGG
jgi:hypothetical protein